MSPPKKCNNRILWRLHRIAGQVHGLERMVTRQESCHEILRQSSAIRGALLSLEELIATDRLKKIRHPKVVQEFLEAYQHLRTQ